METCRSTSRESKPVTKVCCVANSEAFPCKGSDYFSSDHMHGWKRKVGWARQKYCGRSFQDKVKAHCGENPMQMSSLNHTAPIHLAKQKHHGDRVNVNLNCSWCQQYEYSSSSMSHVKGVKPKNESHKDSFMISTMCVCNGSATLLVIFSVPNISVSFTLSQIKVPKTSGNRKGDRALSCWRW